MRLDNQFRLSNSCVRMVEVRFARPGCMEEKIIGKCIRLVSFTVYFFVGCLGAPSSAHGVVLLRSAKVTKLTGLGFCSSASSLARRGSGRCSWPPSDATFGIA
ncbi:hypothetical protein PHMEG_00014322 [Phytophthora megakarya]|uniref:Uncharacterized protein n=1 Tax=Phytophthora megakarya TaxID=4795 RepID=A0A225W4K4_9STRA|nr:hypothetical protein PHMEG_00014322 [Phytophthora megakarya]